ncbi:hypothetical protein Snoj_52650 [Streptomyces nojiriensis]|uniref:Uncharacterized protein n=1 Tax=Streptomyces nojiriensis TaxID=66374 RepID=A0ABQ3STH6_9ACTN|nr:hypothetical protein GCM10010205_20890 [Streptomyces nojiriensis]GHI71347.1 hypothetical protein Snoj_52650 [Streptomyces nojiriensis]
MQALEVLGLVDGPLGRRRSAGGHPGDRQRRPLGLGRRLGRFHDPVDHAEHFSAGHDIGTPGRGAHLPFERRAGLWWDHTGRPGAEARFARESEV